MPRLDDSSIQQSLDILLTHGRIAEEQEKPAEEVANLLSRVIIDSKDFVDTGEIERKNDKLRAAQAEKASGVVLQTRVVSTTDSQFKDTLQLAKIRQSFKSALRE